MFKFKPSEFFKVTKTENGLQFSNGVAYDYVIISARKYAPEHIGKDEFDAIIGNWHALNAEIQKSLNPQEKGENNPFATDSDFIQRNVRVFDIGNIKGVIVILDSNQQAHFYVVPREHFQAFRKMLPVYQKSLKELPRTESVSFNSVTTFEFYATKLNSGYCYIATNDNSGKRSAIHTLWHYPDSED